MIKNLIITSLLLTSVSTAWAQQPGEAPIRKNDKLDIQKLEQKYWAAKDDDFSVVQNRKYSKAQRFFLTGAVGTTFNDAYSEGTLLGINAGYYFNERWGLEFSYAKGELKDNDAVAKFPANGVKPDHNKHDSSYFFTGSFVPFYAKMSVLDKAIIYFDMGVNLGVGMNNYKVQRDTGEVSESSPALRLSVFQQIFFTEHFAIRADFTNTWSSQKRLQYTANPPVGQKRTMSDEVINDSSIMIGLTYWH